MKTKFILPSLFFSILFFALQSVYSQTRIDEIRQIYKAVNEQVRNNELLHDQISINPEQKSEYPAVGLYQKQIDAHYHIGTDEDPYQKRFARVVVKHHFSAQTKQTEYIFDREGVLVFIFFIDEEEKQFRFYFDKDKLIRFMEDQEIKVLQATTSELLENLKHEVTQLTEFLQKL